MPNFKTLGPKYGSDIKNITNITKNKEFKVKEDYYEININDNTEVLNKEDIIVRYISKEGENVVNDNEIVLRLDNLFQNVILHLQILNILIL